MKITMQQLVHRNACGESIKDFNKLAPSGAWEFDCTPQWQLDFIRTTNRKWFGWLVYNTLVPMWSMRGANLWKADLSEANLYGANLWGADLSHEENMKLAKEREATI